MLYKHKLIKIREFQVLLVPSGLLILTKMSKMAKKAMNICSPY